MLRAALRQVRAEVGDRKRSADGGEGYGGESEREERRETEKQRGRLWSEEREDMLRGRPLIYFRDKSPKLLYMFN